MWHQAQFRGDELLVLGYNASNNDVMLVRMAALPMNEQTELRRIAGSRAGKETPYLIPLLRKMESPSGSDWFTYLAKKMEQRNSPVFKLPIKEIQDSLDTDQKAIFKGYGKRRVNRELALEALERDHTDYQDDDTSHGVFGGTAALPGSIDEPDHQPPVHKPNHIESQIAALAESSRQTNDLLNKLVDVLLADKVAAKKAPPKTPPKATRKPRVKQEPDLSKLGHNQGPPFDLNEEV